MLYLYFACIIENGEHHYNAIDQTNSFARFFEDLVIPKDKGNESEFLELCNIRHNVMQQMCEYEDAQETNILEFCNHSLLVSTITITITISMTNNDLCKVPNQY
jgi:hypothetical protein